jgi:hypothetical protein
MGSCGDDPTVLLNNIGCIMVYLHGKEGAGGDRSTLLYIEAVVLVKRT